MDKIAILGLGKTAFSLIRHALDDELYDITVIEQKERNSFQELKSQIDFLTQEGVKFHFGTQKMSLLDDIDIVAISPGFQPDTEIIQYICKLVEQDKIKYLTDLDLFITKLQDLEATVNAVRYIGYSWCFWCGRFVGYSWCFWCGRFVGCSWCFWHYSKLINRFGRFIRTNNKLYGIDSFKRLDRNC